MNHQDDLSELWKSQPSRSGGIKGEDMLALVQKKLRRFDRTVTVRNWLECVAGIAVVVFFLWTAARVPDPVVKIGSLVVAAGAAWIVFYVVRYGNSSETVDPSQDLTSYTRALAARYDHQIRLLKSVKYWYLLPIYIGLLIATAGLFLERAKAGTLGWRDLWGPAIYTALFAAIWWLNEGLSVRRLRREREALLQESLNERR